MDRRTSLNEELVAILGDGTRHVYFQPPNDMEMSYPCIVYERHDINNTQADNDIYLHKIQYTVIVIDRNPDSDIVKRMSKFRNAKFKSHYVADNLNHDSFEIYY